MSTGANNSLSEVDFLEEIRALRQHDDSSSLVFVSLIVFFMQCGFAFAECGSVRARNVGHVFLRNFVVTMLCGGSFWLVGWSMSFGEGNEFVGYSNWALSSSDTSPSFYARWFFQFTAAATATNVAFGSMAERCKFGAYVFSGVVVSGVVYPIAAHWTTSAEGWLLNGPSIADGTRIATLSLQDFAGSGRIHLVGGAAALIGTVMLGPRVGRFRDGGASCEHVRGHSLAFSALGVFILSVGLVALNVGAGYGLSRGVGPDNLVGRICVSTVLSGTSGTLGALLASSLVALCTENRSCCFMTIANGGLSGMVAASAGCDCLSPWASFVVGFVAGLVFMLVRWMLLAVKVDDPPNVVAVHAGGSITGLVLTPIFCSPSGLIWSGSRLSGMQLAWNLAGTGSIVLWSGVCSALVFALLKVFRKLRVDEKTETLGLNLCRHSGPVFPEEQEFPDGKSGRIDGSFLDGPSMSTARITSHPVTSPNIRNANTLEKNMDVAYGGNTSGGRTSGGRTSGGRTVVGGSDTQPQRAGFYAPRNVHKMARHNEFQVRPEMREGSIIARANVLSRYSDHE